MGGWNRLKQNRRKSQTVTKSRDRPRRWRMPNLYLYRLRPRTTSIYKRCSCQICQNMFQNMVFLETVHSCTQPCLHVEELLDCSLLLTFLRQCCNAASSTHVRLCKASGAGSVRGLFQCILIHMIRDAACHGNNCRCHISKPPLVRLGRPCYQTWQGIFTPWITMRWLQKDAEEMTTWCTPEAGTIKACWLGRRTLRLTWPPKTAWAKAAAVPGGSIFGCM